MGSAGHRANIMGRAWDVIGVGAYKGPTGKKMWTVLFADKCGTTSTAPKPTAKPTPRPTHRATPRPTTRPKATPRPTAKPKPAKTATPETTPALDLAPTAEPTPPLDPDDLLPGDEPVTEPTDEPEVVQPTDDPSDGFDGAVGMRVQDRTSTDGLLSTIVGGVTGYFFGG
jgi:outer membrane biosynthesis protein TonB